MKTLHLFAGIGGGIITDQILGNRTIGAVEINEFCRRTLAARQHDGLLAPFPLFADIRDFSGDELEESVDCVCGGFPCQDISCAGKGTGIEGKQSSLFFEMARVVRYLRPAYVFMENSPLIVSRGCDKVLGTLAALGYDAEWTTLSAGELGAPHLRDRWWCVCKRQGPVEPEPESVVAGIERRFAELGRLAETQEAFSDGDGREVENAAVLWGHVAQDPVSGPAQARYDPAGDSCSVLSDEGRGSYSGNVTSARQWRRLDGSSDDDDRDRRSDSRSGAADRLGNARDSVADDCSGDVPDSQNPTENEHEHSGRYDERPEYCPAGEADCGWWEVEPPVGRVVNEFPHRVDAIRGLGNAQVPVVAALAFYLLMTRLCERL